MIFLSVALMMSLQGSEVSAQKVISKKTVSNFKSYIDPHAYVCPMDYREETIKHACESLVGACIQPESIDDGTGTSLRDEDLLPTYKKTYLSLKGKAEDFLLSKLKDPDERWNWLRSLKWNDQMECSSSKDDSCLRAEAKAFAIKFSNSAFAEGNLSLNVSNSRDESLKAENFNGSVLKQLLETDDQKAEVKELRNQLTLIRTEALAPLNETALNDKIDKTIFPEVKKSLEAVITDSVHDEKTRNLLIQQIERIQYGGNQCDDFNESTAKPFGAAGALVENAYFKASDPPRFKICNAYLKKNSSEFSIAHTIMHELSHQIDPCHVTQTGFQYSDPTSIGKSEQDFPFKSLLSCLRSKPSIGAGRKEWMLSKGDREAYQANLKPLLNQKTNAFCFGDQTTESFADWMAAESLPRYMKKQHPDFTINQFKVGYGNALRNLCNDGVLEAMTHKYDNHPSGNARIDRLLLVQPEIRRQMGCDGPDQKLDNGMASFSMDPMDMIDPLPKAKPCQVDSAEAFESIESRWEKRADSPPSFPGLMPSMGKQKH